MTAVAKTEIAINAGEIHSNSTEVTHEVSITGLLATDIEVPKGRDFTMALIGSGFTFFVAAGVIVILVT
ncbi:hypothetical protein [Chthonobacter rhizosphaerae]|uniref:hypothetical protein n=1 Tax=Chthonobacter rhizosphaerae TaxID=2735553 RepID=UPI0015EF9B86|nr:hypothetical protein [Chthonobacter rhizosphaerae]